MQSNERGMKKWMAFQALTPQYEGICKILHNQKKIPRPILDEDKMDEINQVLAEAYNQKFKIIIIYYDDGFLYNYTGILKNISSVFKYIEVVTESGVQHKVLYADIVDVNYID